MWAITPTSLLKKNLTYSSIFKVCFMKSFAAAKASLVFIKNRCRSSRSQMFFKIGVLKKFAMFTGKHLCWSLFLIKLQAFRCFPANITKLLRPGFYRTPPVAATGNVPFDIIFSKRRCWIFVAPPVVICCTTRCRSLYHLLSLVVPLVLARCTTRCQSFSFVACSLSFVVTRCTTRCYLMYHSSVFL